MYDKNYKNKLNELLDRLENEMNYSKFLKREEVEKEIKNLNFDEDKIKSWISSKKPSNFLELTIFLRIEPFLVNTTFPTGTSFVKSGNS